MIEIVGVASFNLSSPLIWYSHPSDVHTQPYSHPSDVHKQPYSHPSDVHTQPYSHPSDVHKQPYSHPSDVHKQPYIYKISPKFSNQILSQNDHSSNQSNIDIM